jgi:hypothetical protein
MVVWSGFMRVLILGGTGLTGPFVVQRLNRLGYEVVVFHRGRWSSIGHAQILDDGLRRGGVQSDCGASRGQGPLRGNRLSARRGQSMQTYVAEADHGFADVEATFDRMQWLERELHLKPVRPLLDRLWTAPAKRATPQKVE